MGGGLAQKEAVCRTAYDQCLARPAKRCRSAGSCEKPVCTCRATVGELETCINDIGPIINQVMGAFPTCQESRRRHPHAPLQPEQPASCKTVDSKCEDLDLPTLPN